MSADAQQIRARVIELEIEHRDLDDVIVRLSSAPDRDDLQLRLQRIEGRPRKVAAGLIAQLQDGRDRRRRVFAVFEGLPCIGAESRDHEMQFAGLEQRVSGRGRDLFKRHIFGRLQGSQGRLSGPVLKVAGGSPSIGGGLDALFFGALDCTRHQQEAWKQHQRRDHGDQQRACVAHQHAQFVAHQRCEGVVHEVEPADSVVCVT